jgi:hypothetical protein
MMIDGITTPAIHGIEVDQHFLQAEEVPRRFRRIHRQVRIGWLFERRVERDGPNKKNHRDDHGGQKFNSDKVGPNVQLPRPARSPRLDFAMVRLRQFGICFELFDQLDRWRSPA